MSNSRSHSYAEEYAMMQAQREEYDDDEQQQQHQQQQPHHGHSHSTSSMRSLSSNASASSAAGPPGSVKRPGSASGSRGRSAAAGMTTPQSSSSGSVSSSALVPSSAVRYSQSQSAAIEELKKNFKVVVRIRPPLPRELDGSRSGGSGAAYRDIVRTEERGRAVTICENGISQPSSHSVLNADGSVTSTSISNTGSYASHKFTFDYVYDQDAQQSDVYSNTARDAVMSTLQGYNATILAYGQTGTGKTFTMEGFDDSELRGIIPRSVEEIFNYIQNTAHTNVRFLVRASYLQIYNEVISDLLKPERSNLSIREDRKKGVFVEGLSEWVVRSPKEVYGLIKRGTSIRATGSTRINETSSRSHALFIIIVEQNEMIYEDPAVDGNAQNPEASSNSEGMNEQEKVARVAGSGTLVRQSFKVGKLNLVDLAGSERVRISGAKGKRLEESKHINQSLSALGNVISSLTEGNRKHSQTQRDVANDSKLTRILEDSFGGNVKCTLLAMISPAQEAFLESLSTLKFANRAKKIQNEAKINEDLDEKALLRRYERELKKLRSELQAKSKNVVDKRKLIEVEEKHRRAEQDKMTALMNMERLSRDLLQEKTSKKKLEERIKEMNSQLLVGGHLNAGGAGGATGGPGPDSEAQMAENAKAFQQALQVEQDRIRATYSQKLQELEKERESMEEEKAQTSRYKQLLLKQRDIMIQLTARLNERDQSILLLQEELDAYDKHQRAMEDELDQKRHRLIQLQRMNVGAGSNTDFGPLGSPIGGGGGGGGMDGPASPSSGGGSSGGANLYGLFPIDEAPYFEENAPSPGNSARGEQQHPSYAAVAAHTAHPSSSSAQGYQPLLSSSPPLSGSSSASPTSPGFDPAMIEHEVQRRVAMELVAVRRGGGGGAGSSSGGAEDEETEMLRDQLAHLSDALDRKESETLRLRDELARAGGSGAGAGSGSAADQQVHQLSQALKSRDEHLSSLQAQNASLLQNVAALQGMIKDKSSSSSAPSSAASSDETRSLKDSLSSLKRKYDVQLQERAALKVILEKKMKALIDSIASATLNSASTPKTPGGGAGGASPSPTDAAGAGKGGGDLLPARTKREIEVLQRLVEASLTALKNSDVNAASAASSASSASGEERDSSSRGYAAASPSNAGSLSSSAPRYPPSQQSQSYARSQPRASPTSSPSSASSAGGYPSSSPDGSSLSSSGGGGGGMDNIEKLIQQRKDELQRMDERQR